MASGHDELAPAEPAPARVAERSEVTSSGVEDSGAEAAPGRSPVVQLVGQVIRFGLVGGLATLVHLGVAWWALATRPEWSPFLVNLVAFVVAFQVSFWGHSRFTFRQKGSALKFLVVTVSGFAINNSLLWVFLKAGVSSDFLAICLSVLLVPLFVFVASRVWVFSR